MDGSVTEGQGYEWKKCNRDVWECNGKKNKSVTGSMEMQ